MTTIKHQKLGKSMVLADDFYDLIRTKQEFCEWLYRRITNYQMELGKDYFITLSTECVKNIIEYESLNING